MASIAEDWFEVNLSGMGPNGGYSTDPQLVNSATLPDFSLSSLSSEQKKLTKNPAIAADSNDLRRTRKRPSAAVQDTTKPRKAPKRLPMTKIVVNMQDEESRTRYVVWLLENLDKDIICSFLCRLIEELVPKRKSRFPFQSSRENVVIEAPFFWPREMEWKSVHHQRKPVVLPLAAYLLRLHWSPDLWMAFNCDVEEVTLKEVEWPAMITRVLNNVHDERVRSAKSSHAAQLLRLEDLCKFVIDEYYLVCDNTGASKSFEYSAEPHSEWPRMVKSYGHIILRPWENPNVSKRWKIISPQQCSSSASNVSSGPTTPESFNGGLTCDSGLTAPRSRVVTGNFDPQENDFNLIDQCQPGYVPMYQMPSHPLAQAPYHFWPGYNAALVPDPGSFDTHAPMAPESYQFHAGTLQGMPFTNYQLHNSCIPSSLE